MRERGGARTLAWLRGLAQRACVHRHGQSVDCCLPVVHSTRSALFRYCDLTRECTASQTSGPHLVGNVTRGRCSGPGHGQTDCSVALSSRSGRTSGAMAGSSNVSSVAALSTPPPPVIRRLDSLSCADYSRLSLVHAFPRCICTARNLSPESPPP